MFGELPKTQETNRLEPVVVYAGGLAITGIAPRSLEWQERGACTQVGDSGFFPEKGGHNKAIKALCATCPVRLECLNYALSQHDEFGFWGGFSVDERKVIARQLKQAQRDL